MKESHFKVYVRIIAGLGGYGIKELLFIILGHLNPHKVPFYIKSRKLGPAKFYVRTNTSDLQIVRSFLLDNGEYDWIMEGDYYKYVKKATTFIDAGANIGVVSRILTAINPQIKGYALEPDVENYNICTNNLKDQCDVNVMNVGLWNKKTKLNVIERNNGSQVGFVVEENENGSIDAVTVDDVISDNHYIDIFKMDIEGSEYYVFDESSDKWIDRVGMFIIEFHDRIIEGCEEKVISRLSEHGFKHIGKMGENDVFINHYHLKEFLYF